MTTVKTWKAERTERTINWVNEVVKPTIERLANKGKERVVFNGINDNINLDLVAELLKGYKVNVLKNSLTVNWKEEISVDDVLKTLG